MNLRRSARISQRRSHVEDIETKARHHDSSHGDEPRPAADSDTEPFTEPYTEPALTDSDAETSRPAKRRKVRPRMAERSTGQGGTTSTASAPSTLPGTTDALPIFPSRAHCRSYHRPLLLASPSARAALLAWFDRCSAQREMPWRKPWSDPSGLDRAALSRRAYEVWISEVMLQQTRVPVVRAYWARWMARWPTIWDLARAGPDDVLAMWRGLGYYARARRVWEAARRVCEDDAMGGVLPGSVDQLVRDVPGVGRYTAGAIAAIVFGVPAAMVDGNVLRVLSRQLGLLGDVKADRRVVDLLWEAAEALAQAVARDGADGEQGEPAPSDRPGRWGQALMELGSTVCAPKPNCAVCPITATCRAYAEGLALATGRSPDALAGDIEDPCGICAPFELAALGDEDQRGGNGTRNEPKPDSRSSRFFTATEAARPKTGSGTRVSDPLAMETIIDHAKKFPLRKAKKKVREEEALVCAIRRSSDGRYLLHKRPDNGLLGGLWELPTLVLPGSENSTGNSRRRDAVSYVTGLLGTEAAGARDGRRKMCPKHAGDLGSVPWLFSHLKLTMHVHLFEVGHADDATKPLSERRWASVEDIDGESMGTGMRKCWSMVKEATT